MPKTKAKRETFWNKLVRILREELEKAGLKAEVDYQILPGIKLRRIWISCRGFEKLWHSERQDLVWRIVNFNFVQEDQLRISMILTLTPKELRGE